MRRGRGRKPADRRGEGEGTSALERHASFFDRDGDGSVTPAETFESLRDLGVGAALGAVLTSLIHLALGPITQRRPSLTIRVDAIARGKRRRSSGAFGPDGKFVAPAFERLRGQPPGDGALTFRELSALIASNPSSRTQNPLEIFFSWAETRVLFCLAADTHRREGGRDTPAISQKRLRSFYAGDLFYALARRRRLSQRRRPTLF